MFPRHALLAVIVALLIPRWAAEASQAAPSSAALSPWLQGWPMIGHDPQRTNRSTVTGPTHPRLLATRDGFSTWLVGPDGSLYGGVPNRPGLTALEPSGRLRWTVHDCCGEGDRDAGAVGLAPNGMLLATGINTPDGTGTQDDTEALGIALDGRVSWRIQPFGVLKGAQVLVTDTSMLYAPIMGPSEGGHDGVNVISSDGTLLHRVFDLQPYISLAPDGTIYTAGAYLNAFRPDGTLRWQRALLFGRFAYDESYPVVGADGTIYIGYGQNIAAFTPAGRRLWRLQKADHALRLALRADGVILAAGRRSLDAISPMGKRLWRVRINDAPIPKSFPPLPSLIVDRVGTAYVTSGTRDGRLQVVSPDGKVLSQLSGVSRPVLAPNGTLIVSSAGVADVYGQ